MKKQICSLLFLSTISLMGWSQEIIVPKKNVVAQKWIKDQSYQMSWAMVRDTNRMTIGVVSTKVEVLGDKVQVVTEVKMKGSPAPWIDSTIVRKTDLSPVYHASYNIQRDMALHFGTTVKGFYRDKQTNKTTEIAQQVPSGYFDSNFYPMLINWLPLKSGYTADIDIYDYNPKGKMGVVKAHILSVSEGKYLSKKLGDRKVWIVEAADEIGAATDGKSVYQIDQLTRQLWKQRITAGGRVMEMTVMEE